MAKITLDNNERGYLLAINEVDPKGEMWLTAYATGLDPAKHGADAIGCTFEGGFQVLKRLKQRKLVESDGRMTQHTGVALTDKGREAIADAEAS